MGFQSRRPLAIRLTKAIKEKIDHSAKNRPINSTPVFRHQGEGMLGLTASSSPVSVISGGTTEVGAMTSVMPSVRVFRVVMVIVVDLAST